MTSTSPLAPPSLPLVPPQEETMLRETVRSICLSFGDRYTREKVAAEEPPTELWDALASRGYLGVNIPEEYDGGGLGMSALAAVGEEIAAAGVGLILIVVSPAIVGSILTRHGTPDQKDVWLRGHRHRHDQGRVRDHRAGRRQQLAQPVDRRAQDRPRLGAARPEDLHLRRRGGRRDPGRRAQARGERPARPAAADDRRRGRARDDQDAHPDRGARRQQAVAALLRRRRGARTTG